MPPVDVTALFDVAAALLAAVEDYYAANAPDDPLPDRRYVANGSEAWDCEQATVRVSRTFAIDDTGQETGALPLGPIIRRGAEMHVQLVRCVPVLSGGNNPRPPTAQAIETSAAVILSDAERLADAVVTGYRDGSLPGCGGLTVIGWDGFGPQGGLSGGELTVRVVLD